MAMSAQRDLVSSIKTETFLNVSIISKLQPLPSELKQLFNREAFEKLTQNLFNPLSYYLVSIVDPNKASSLSWPLYDTKTERAYRNELSSFVANYSAKGLLSPVMSSYLVNPASYKVTLFMFQLSQLAVQKILKGRMKKDHQKKLYSEMTEKYKSASQDQGFIEAVDRENELLLMKLSNYLQKRKKYEKIAVLFCDRITSMEEKLGKLKVQEYIANLVDSYKEELDEETKSSIVDIKNINKPAEIFDVWLEEFDSELHSLESEWDTKMSPMVETASRTMELTKALIERQTGEADKSTYMIEYNHNVDEICTKDLQDKVNSQQKYILKNIVKQERLSFPQLIRGYVVAVSYILKNRQISGGVYQFNKYLQEGNKSYSEMVEAMKNLLERVIKVESRLMPTAISFNQSISPKDIPLIPPLPDLSDLTMKRDTQRYFDSFTPLGLNKHQLNLRKTNRASFLKPQSQSFMTFQAPRDDFLKNFVSSQLYERQNSSHNIHNMSIISQVNARSNETIAGCSAGFTQQQIQRLLSTTKKSSSSKKHKFKLDRPPINIKKGGLFNTSNTSNESVLIRSHSSPNLIENRDKQFNLRRRKLSIMQEGSPSLLEVSGIMALENKFTPEHLQKSLLVNDTSSFTKPSILVTSAVADSMKENKHAERHAVLEDKLMPHYLQKSLLLKGSPTFAKPSITVTPETPDRSRRNKNSNRDSTESGIASSETINPIGVEVNTTNDNTPKSRIPIPVKKTSSIEKIINRFKKVRASVIQDSNKEDIKTIVEEKENFNTVNVDVFTANKVLLPDLLSPSCSMFSIKSSEFLELCEDKTEVRKPRESLGTALGVDNTFLDQFDLID